MNKTFLIHVVIEAVILGVITIVTFKKMSALRTEVESLKALVQQQTEQNKQCFAHIQKLYSSVDMIMDNMQQPSAPPQRRAPSMYREQRMAAKESPLFYPQPPMSVPQQQPQQQQKDPDVLFSLLNMMPAMMVPNPAASIMAELEKSSQVQQQPKPSVEVINEEDDPDIQEALAEHSEDEKDIPSITTAPVFLTSTDTDDERKE